MKSVEMFEIYLSLSMDIQLSNPRYIFRFVMVKKKNLNCLKIEPKDYKSHCEHRKVACLHDVESILFLSMIFAWSSVCVLTFCFLHFLCLQVNIHFTFFLPFIPFSFHVPAIQSDRSVHATNAHEFDD